MSDWKWPWPQDAWPTPEQLWEGLNRAPAEERRTLLAMLIGNSQEAARYREEGT